jgi:hypothetical protein
LRMMSKARCRVVMAGTDMVLPSEPACGGANNRQRRCGADWFGQNRLADNRLGKDAAPAIDRYQSRRSLPDPLPAALPKMPGIALFKAVAPGTAPVSAIFTLFPSLWPSRPGGTATRPAVHEASRLVRVVGAAAIGRPWWPTARATAGSPKATGPISGNRGLAWRAPGGRRRGEIRC